MARRTFARIGPAHAERDFLIAAAVAVDGDRHRDRTLPLHALDVMLGDLEFVGGVELRPDRPAARRNRVGDRRRCLRREDHQVVADLGGARDAFLAVRVIGLMAAGRIDDDRRLIFLSENFRAHVDLADIDKTARPELEFHGSPRDWRAASRRRRRRRPCSRNGPAARSCAPPVRNRRYRAPLSGSLSDDRSRAAPRRTDRPAVPDRAPQRSAERLVPANNGLAARN